MGPSSFPHVMERRSSLLTSPFPPLSSPTFQATSSPLPLILFFSQQLVRGKGVRVQRVSPLFPSWSKRAFLPLPAEGREQLQYSLSPFLYRSDFFFFVTRTGESGPIAPPFPSPPLSFPDAVPPCLSFSFPEVIEYIGISPFPSFLRSSYLFLFLFLVSTVASVGDPSFPLYMTSRPLFSFFPPSSEVIYGVPPPLGRAGSFFLFFSAGLQSDHSPPSFFSMVCPSLLFRCFIEVRETGNPSPFFSSACRPFPFLVSQ